MRNERVEIWRIRFKATIFNRDFLLHFDLPSERKARQTYAYWRTIAVNRDAACSYTVDPRSRSNSSLV